MDFLIQIDFPRRCSKYSLSICFLSSNYQQSPFSF